MAVSWAKGIAIAEPAPRLAQLARYLAPHWKGLLYLESENGVGVVATVTFFTLIAGAVFGAGGAGFALLAVEVTGCHWLVRFWLGFDAVLGLCLTASYWLVGRYGLRFYDVDPSTNPLWRLVTIGNSSWRCLPRAHRETQKPRLRALNTAARILLTDPEDDRTRDALAAHAEMLRSLSTTVLADSTVLANSRPELPHGAVVVRPLPVDPHSGMRRGSALTDGCGTLSLAVPLQHNSAPTEAG